MTHPTQLELAMHADNALSNDEASLIDSHVDTCSFCQKRLSALQLETQHMAAALRADVLQYDPELVVPRFSRPISLRGFALANIATALTIWFAQFLWKTLFGEVILNSAAWLTSLFSPNIYQMANTTTLYLLEEGTAMLDAYLGFVIATVLILTVVALLLMRARIRADLLSVCLLAGAAGTLIAPVPAQALDYRHSEGVLNIPASETIDDSLIVRGETILIEGTITGDVLAMGNEINVTGSIHGNLFTFAENVKVRGDIGGLVLGAGNSFTFSAGSAGGDLLLTGEKIVIGSNVRIGRNAAFAANKVTVAANINKDLYAYAESVEFSGKLDGRMEVFAERLRLLSATHIAGNVSFHGDEEGFFRADDVRIDGELEISPRPAAKNRYATIEFYLWQFAQLVAAFLFGLALFWLVPGLRSLSIGAGVDGLKSAGIGIITLVSVPIIAVLVAITIIGLPFAFVALFTWLLGIYLATIILGAAIGGIIMTGSTSLPRTLLVGLTVVMVAVNLPLIGGIVGFILTIIGLGMLVQFLLEVISRASGESASG